MTPSFVTWQLRRLHEEIDGIDEQRGTEYAPLHSHAIKGSHDRKRDQTARRALLDRTLRSLPKRFGFRDARSFAQAFARANHLLDAGMGSRVRRRLTAAQIRELERRILAHERPIQIARVIGCAEQTVLNRSSQLRKRLAEIAERDASGI